LHRGNIVKADAVKPVEIFSVPIASAHGFVWKWRSEDGTSESRKAFVYFDDCRQDARRHGFAITSVRTDSGDHPAPFQRH
jgi:hypothetical protein